MHKEMCAMVAHGLPHYWARQFLPLARKSQPSVPFLEKGKAGTLDYEDPMTSGVVFPGASGTGKETPSEDTKYAFTIKELP